MSVCPYNVLPKRALLLLVSQFFQFSLFFLQLLLKFLRRYFYLYMVGRWLEGPDNAQPGVISSCYHMRYSCNMIFTFRDLYYCMSLQHEKDKYHIVRAPDVITSLSCEKTQNFNNLVHYSTKKHKMEAKKQHKMLTRNIFTNTQIDFFLC